jgi:hypothetical protein
MYRFGDTQLAGRTTIVASQAVARESGYPAGRTVRVKSEVSGMQDRPAKTGR